MQWLDILEHSSNGVCNFLVFSNILEAFIVALFR